MSGTGGKDTLAKFGFIVFFFSPLPIHMESSIIALGKDCVWMLYDAT